MSAEKPAKPAKKKRSPIERVIVWGLIIGLLVMVALEARGQYAYGQTMKAIEDYQDNHKEPLKVSELKSLAKLMPSVTEEPMNGERGVLVKWSNLLSFRQKYEMWLPTDAAGDDAKIIGAPDVFLDDDKPIREPRAAGDDLTAPSGMNPPTGDETPDDGDDSGGDDN